MEIALGELPEIYKEELANRLLTAYVNVNAPSVLRSNIEFVTPILWKVLPKNVRVQVVRRVDQEIQKGQAQSTAQAFAFVRVVGGTAYLSAYARKYTIQPLVEKLKTNLDNWKVENSVVEELSPYAAVIPADLLDDYVSALVHTYVGTMGSSLHYNRTDFFANGAAFYIPGMCESFDDRAAEAFIRCVEGSDVLRRRIVHAPKLRRLRALANIVHERSSPTIPGRDLLDILVDESQEEKLMRILSGKKTKRG